VVSRLSVLLCLFFNYTNYTHFFFLIFLMKCSLHVKYMRKNWKRNARNFIYIYIAEDTGSDFFPFLCAIQNLLLVRKRIYNFKWYRFKFIKIKELEIIMNVLLFILLVTPTFGIYVQNELNNVTKRYNPSSPAEWTEPEGIWSSLLEEWTLSNR
jgi:hypothetical protein